MELLTNNPMEYQENEYDEAFDIEAKIDQQAELEKDVEDLAAEMGLTPKEYLELPSEDELWPPYPM